MKKIKTGMTLAAAVALAVGMNPFGSLYDSRVCAEDGTTAAKEVTLRVCNWE